MSLQAPAHREGSKGATHSETEELGQAEQGWFAVLTYRPRCPGSVGHRARATAEKAAPARKSSSLEAELPHSQRRERKAEKLLHGPERTWRQHAPREQRECTLAPACTWRICTRRWAPPRASRLLSWETHAFGEKVKKKKFPLGLYHLSPQRSHFQESLLANGLSCGLRRELSRGDFHGRRGRPWGRAALHRLPPSGPFRFPEFPFMVAPDLWIHGLGGAKDSLRQRSSEWPATWL
ncbi:uncharacterized protein LOC102151561 [Canis lupus familiaris]|uniref:uncharacterized protein LOC102151561 n=1 Tax=Canis lupus familiaris TaxID=9615 RepID=UPI0018F365F1|nr:uncharacterized protein LOC102151561 [Canis lupus familiaris]